MVRSNFDASVEAYTQFEREYGLFARLTHDLASRCGLGPGHRVLDVGCGTGDSVVALASVVGPTGMVVGVDTSASMLACAAARARRASGPRIHLVQADGEDPGLFCRTSFDAVLYNASAFLLPDARRSFCAAASLVDPGGAVGVSVLTGLLDASTGEDLIEEYREDPRVRMRDGRIVQPSRMAVMLEQEVGPVRTWSIESTGGVDEARAFYRIPAQSASLFPRRPVQERLEGVDRFFGVMRRDGHDPVLGWALHVARAEGQSGPR